MLPNLVMMAGVALWAGAHLWKRVAPDNRARWGEPGKALVTALLLVSLVLMVLGYRAADFVPLWDPPVFMRHINNLLMVLAVYMFAASGMKTRITGVIRHPQLTAAKLWAVAHLIVNGDLSSVLLFTGILAWAVAEVIVLKRAGAPWTKPATASAGREAGAILGAVVVTLLIGVVHGWLGYWPFG